MKMPLLSHCLAAFMLLLLLSSPAKQGGEARVPTCCLRTYDTKVPVKQLVEYKPHMQPLCPVNALRFKTKMGKTICSDPTSPWAIKAKEYLDKKNKPLPTYSRGTSQQTTPLKPEVQTNGTSTNGMSFHA